MDLTAIDENDVKQAFYKSTEKAHVIACWIGIVLNLAWFASDYFVLPNYWIPFLAFRVCVSAISLLALLFKQQLKISIFTCAFILVLGISIQNAYMWSVMDVEHLQKHAFAYIALFIGVGMLVLWDFKLSLVLLLATIISNILFYSINSTLSISQFLINGGMLTLTVAIFCVFLIRNRYRLTYNEIKSRLQLEKSKALIEFQKEEVDEKNKEIISSLRYAKRLQEALLPPKNLLDSFFNDNYFILYNPRDIVSGDFYWATQIKTTPNQGNSKDYLLLAVADCTGHGVPGAFMSMIGNSILNEIILTKKITSPSAILSSLNRSIFKVLKQNTSESRDGMDMALCMIDPKNNTLTYSGANRELLLIRNGELIEYKPTKNAIGGFTDSNTIFKETVIDIQPNDLFYMTTDGYADQFGGEKGKKLMTKNFKDFLLQIHTLPMPVQQDELDKKIQSWMGNAHAQVDDILVIGIKL